jgi:indole-3-glycerol phosphate synthase
MTSALDKILAETRRTVAECKAATPIQALERAAAAHRPRGFAKALRRHSASGPAVIAEIKKASPSRGLIRESFDVPALARQFAEGGAAALSVLTDGPFFQGSLENLVLASDASGLPCLRKDFMVDPYQLVEARAHCADAILLIAAALSDAELRLLAREAHACELDILCEVHTADELSRVLDLDLACEAIGVNNRDLKSFAVRLEVSLALAERLPSNVVHVAESGIETADHILQLQNAGFQGFLIGESLMRKPDAGQALAQLLAAVQERSSTPGAPSPNSASAVRG